MKRKQLALLKESLEHSFLESITTTKSIFTLSELEFDQFKTVMDVMSEFFVKMIDVLNESIYSVIFKL